ncbi:MAG TPA: sulfite exporter TauE/SafE family protein [Phycisphaerales bacterium]|nr:sulfite exporter TauE/SafE family protein [Phycisphaerales bacterium]HRQ75096.1 sulfite exporter TauE/SafE family protein [Phycisphaerales bacterium]
MTPFEISLLIAAALLASTIAAVTGTGGGVILLPVMILFFGARDAIPMYAVAQLIGNLSRVVLNRREIRLNVVGWFMLGAVPMGILGAIVFAKTPEAGLVRLLGGFLLLCVIVRHARANQLREFSPGWFAPIGGVFAFISALLGSAGPFLAPFFVAFGLVKGAYIGTEALATVTMHLSKLPTYYATGTLSQLAIVTGLALGPVMILGSYIGKRIVDRIPAKAFAIMIDVIVVVFGVLFMVRG